MGDPVSTVIALNILSTFAADLIKWAAGKKVTPLDLALTATANAFPHVNGVEKTLKEWLQQPSVAEQVRKLVEGEESRADLPIDALTASLIEGTRFYYPDDSALPQQLVATFLTNVRKAYLTDGSGGFLHLANQQEATHAKIDDVIAQVQSAGGLKPSLQTHFDEANAKLEAFDYVKAKALFEVLIKEIERAPIKIPDLERRRHVGLAKSDLNLGN